MFLNKKVIIISITLDEFFLPAGGFFLVAGFEETMIYGFALFFVFAALMIMLLRHSNRQLVTKVSKLRAEFSDEISKARREMRRIIFVNAREKKELLFEIEKIKGTAPEEKGFPGKETAEVKIIA